MTIVATGIFKHPYILRVMLAECATFQSIVGESTNAAAQTHVALHDTDDLDDEIHTSEFPRAIIVRGDQASEAAGTAMSFLLSVSLTIHFEFNVPAGQNLVSREDQEIWFMNQIGAIMSELETVSNNRAAVGGMAPLWLRGHKLTNGPDVIADEERAPDLVEPSTPQRREPVWFCSIGIDL